MSTTLTLRKLMWLCEQHGLSLDAPLALSVNVSGATGGHVLRTVTGVLRHDEPGAPPRLVLVFDGPRSGTFHERLELARDESEFTELARQIERAP